MALKIAKDAALTNVVSGANPITTEHPTTGSSVEQKLYLFNDNAAKKYTNIQIDPVDISGSDESNYIQLAPDNAGSAGTYLSGSAILSMADINDSNVGKPFWMKVTTPAVADSQNKTDLQLNVTAKEYAV